MVLPDGVGVDGGGVVMNFMIKNMPCQICQEVIPFPQIRKDTDGNAIGYICSKCYSVKRKTGPRESGEAADRQYHGDRFYGGEW